MFSDTFFSLFSCYIPPFQYFFSKQMLVCIAWASFTCIGYFYSKVFARVKAGLIICIEQFGFGTPSFLLGLNNLLHWAFAQNTFYLPPWFCFPLVSWTISLFPPEIHRFSVKREKWLRLALRLFNLLSVVQHSPEASLTRSQWMATESKTEEATLLKSTSSSSSILCSAWVAADFPVIEALMHFVPPTEGGATEATCEAVQVSISPLRLD